MNYLYLQYVNNFFAHNALYTEHENSERWIMYKLQSAMLRRVFESLLDFNAVALRGMKPETSTRSAVELDKQEQVVETRPDSKKLLFSLINRKNEVFATSRFWFHDNALINIRVPYAERFDIDEAWQPDQRQLLLTNSARAPLLTAPEKEEKVLEMTVAAGSSDSSKETR